MTTESEVTINFNFKLVYTDIVYNIEISNHATLDDLFSKACEKFTPHINYEVYYIDYVVAGQKNCELASAVGTNNLDHTLWYEFGRRWREVSFYVRPVNRNTESFHRMDNYNVVPFNHLAPETQESDTQGPETQESDTQGPETESTTEITDSLGVNLPSPPGLIR